MIFHAPKEIEVLILLSKSGTDEITETQKLLLTNKFILRLLITNPMNSANSQENFLLMIISDYLYFILNYRRLHVYVDVHFHNIR